MAEATLYANDENDRVPVNGGMAGDHDGQEAGFKISDHDLDNLKKRHPFLVEYSDTMLRSYPIETLLKLESTSIKLKNLEKSRAAEERLAVNRDSLVDTLIKVKEGEDNRITRLHEARFLPGMSCSASKMWEAARKQLGNKGHQAIGTYDMKSIGLAGHVTPQGWGAIHDPGSSSISLKMFSINNCGRKLSFKNGEQDDGLVDVAEVGEFKMALRVMREAMAFVHPWNKSVAAIEGFLLQSHFCSKDLEGLDKQAVLLTQFTDYILRENSNRWRGLEAFVSIEEMKGAWDSFFGARPQSMLAKSRRGQSSGSGPQQGQGQPQGQLSGGGQLGGRQVGAGRPYVHPSLFYEDICVMWNVGKCNKAPGNCFTKGGKPLRHVCNFRPDYTRNMPPCGANHASCFYH